jgi:tetratricopeptide (TPR) repeat protein
MVLACARLLAQKPDSLLDRIRNCPVPVERREELARSYDAKDYGGAEAILQQQAAAAGKTPQAGELYALAGAVEFVGGRMDQSVGDFRMAESLAPVDDTDRFTWAMALVNLGETKGAREQLTRLHDSHPDRPLYLYWLARMDYDQRLYEEAVQKLRRVIRLDPESARAYDNLGLALDMLGHADEAREAFQKAVDFNRKLPQPSAWPPHNLGALLLRLQQPKEAETALREALRIDPRFAMAHYHLGRVLDEEGRDDEAIAEYRAATSMEPVVVEALYSLGLVYRRHERRGEAEAAFAEYKRRKAQ